MYDFEQIWTILMYASIIVIISIAINILYIVVCHAQIPYGGSRYSTVSAPIVLLSSFQHSFTAQKMNKIVFFFYKTIVLFFLYFELIYYFQVLLHTYTTVRLWHYNMSKTVNAQRNYCELLRWFNHLNKLQRRKIPNNNEMSPRKHRNNKEKTLKAFKK